MDDIENMNDNIKVTVICITYNHEPFIRTCLEGFVKQKTNFSFEVIVHDDASTDGTAEIIREFEKKYPDIIKPIYQIENQYSRGVAISEKYVWPKAKGKYFALCEGDDYWTDSYKLQKQYDFMETNTDYAICVHNAELHDLEEETVAIIPNVESSRDCPTEEIIAIGGGIFATNSVFAKREIITNMPQCFCAEGFGDYQIFIYGSIVGKCRCLSDVMSVYNFGVPGSWTVRTLGSTERRYKFLLSMLNLLDSIDDYYNGKYSEAIEIVRKRYRKEKFDILRRMERYRELLKKEWRDILKSCSMKEQVYIYCHALTPQIMLLYKKMCRK